jgi:hypothetical protein
MALHRRMIGKDLEGRCLGLIEVLFHHFPGGTEINHENLSQNSRCPVRVSSRAPSEYKCGVLPPDLPVW